MSDENKSVGSGSGTTFAYYVEARLNYYKPDNFGGLLLGKEWQRVEAVLSATGIPTPKYAPSAIRELNLLTKAQAEAIRWIFIANADADLKSMCLETRLVKVKVKYSYEGEVVETLNEIHRDETP